MYPQSHGSLTIVGIDASKGFVDLWVHFFLAMECIHRNGYRRKLLFWSFDSIQTCLIFPFRWACYPVKSSRNAQWEHLFSMDFDEFFNHLPFFEINKNTLKWKCLLDKFDSKMAKSHQNIKRYIQIQIHFRWENHLSVGTPYTCDYLL